MSNMIPKQSKTTSKKVKYVGSEIFMNEKGEPIEMQVSSIEERDYNFNKIFMREFLYTLDQFGNKKLQVATYIMDNADGNNMFIGTYEDICNKTGYARQTVFDTIKILRNSNFLRKKSSGVYMINPDIIAKGTHQHRLNICRQYNDINAPKITKQERINNLEKSIKKMQDTLAKLKQE